MTLPTPAPALAKPPRQVFETVFAFAPNRATLGDTAYLIIEKDEAGQPANLLVDAPAWDAGTQAFLAAHGGVRWLLITHRGASGEAKAIQAECGCEIVVQEQEAYLLPDAAVTAFGADYRFTPRCQTLWTPGYSPGTCCLYYQAAGGILFTGRHLLPDRQGQPAPPAVCQNLSLAAPAGPSCPAADRLCARHAGLPLPRCQHRLPARRTGH